LPAGALLGLALGSIVLLIRESANPRLATPEGVRAALGLPVLGSIPTSAARTIETFGWSVHADATGEAAEAFRAVRTSLQFGLSETGGGRRVVITSPEQMDGKSTLASNLAIALAKSGKNVLLVDANLRDPSQHRIFGVSDSVGLVDVLASGELNERAIRRTTIERLHVLPAGAVPKNPSELLNSSALNDTIEQLGTKYDLVLVDTPAVGVVDDARIVAAGCEGAILVVRSGRTNRRLASAARDGLLSVGCPVVGVVVNGCRTSGAGAYGGATAFPLAGRKGGADSQSAAPVEGETDAASSMQESDRSI
jgi:capsular exopolysaccharide synthesis family protein